MTKTLRGFNQKQTNLVLAHAKVFNFKQMTDEPDTVEDTPELPEHEEVSRARDDEFHEHIDALIRDAESTRLSFMKRHRTRGNVTMTLGLLSLTIGAGGFGWYLLMQADIIKATGSMLIAITIPILLHFWSMAILNDYKKNYKKEFLPRLAHALGGFKFHPSRGISSKIISKTGLVPKHEVYNAEDCFMGKYKGVKVLFSEARLMQKKKHAEPIFDGVFVLLEIPKAVIEGHTILTADERAYQKWKPSRWQKLQDVRIKTGNAEWDRFHILSDNPESAKLLIGERLLKELSEAADIFDESPLSAALFRGKFIFLMIPYKGDMFEASNIHVPVATKQHAMQCRREIEQILEIIDVFDLYEPAETPAPSNTEDKAPAPSED